VLPTRGPRRCLGAAPGGYPGSQGRHPAYGCGSAPEFDRLPPFGANSSHHVADRQSTPARSPILRPDEGLICHPDFGARGVRVMRNIGVFAVQLLIGDRGKHPERAVTTRAVMNASTQSRLALDTRRASWRGAVPSSAGSVVTRSELPSSAASPRPAAFEAGACASTDDRGLFPVDVLRDVRTPPPPRRPPP
jgi:hypothetical protein